MQCRALAAQLGRHYPDFQAENTEVLIILGGSIENARAYVDLLKLPFPVLADPERQVYHRYGLHKIFLLQRSAAMIIDRDGFMRYLRRAVNPLTWLGEFQELLVSVRQVNHSFK
jgi:peroxiredoxin